MMKYSSNSRTCMFTRHIAALYWFHILYRVDPSIDVHMKCVSFTFVYVCISQAAHHGHHSSGVDIHSLQLLHHSLLLRAALRRGGLYANAIDTGTTENIVISMQKVIIMTFAVFQGVGSYDLEDADEEDS